MSHNRRSARTRQLHVGVASALLLAATALATINASAAANNTSVVATTASAGGGDVSVALVSTQRAGDDGPVDDMSPPSIVWSRT
jgi:hypothetical protein